METESQAKPGKSEALIDTPAEIAQAQLQVPRPDPQDAHDPEADETEISPVAEPENGDSFAFTVHVHDYISDYVRLADQKAGFVFAIAAALLVFLFERGSAKGWGLNLAPATFADWAGLLAMLGLGLSALLTIWVVAPRLRGSPRGHIFWRSVASFDSSSEYAASAARLREPKQIVELRRHSYELSVVCDRKYRALNWAIRSGAFGLVALLAFLWASP